MDLLLDRTIRTAILARRMVRFRFDGGLRVGEPHDYGEKGGAAHLLVYQTAGESRSGKLPNWRRFDLSRVTDFELLDRRFSGSRPAPSGQHSAWDRIFLRVGERA